MVVPTTCIKALGSTNSFTPLSSTTSSCLFLQLKLVISHHKSNHNSYSFPFSTQFITNDFPLQPLFLRLILTPGIKVIGSRNQLWRVTQYLQRFRPWLVKVHVLFLLPRQSNSTIQCYLNCIICRLLTNSNAAFLFLRSNEPPAATTRPEGAIVQQFRNAAANRKGGHTRKQFTLALKGEQGGNQQRTFCCCEIQQVFRNSLCGPISLSSCKASDLQPQTPLHRLYENRCRYIHNLLHAINFFFCRYVTE